MKANSHNQSQSTQWPAFEIDWRAFSESHGKTCEIDLVHQGWCPIIGCHFYTISSPLLMSGTIFPRAVLSKSRRHRIDITGLAKLDIIWEYKTKIAIMQIFEREREYRYSKPLKWWNQITRAKIHYPDTWLRHHYMQENHFSKGIFNQLTIKVWRLCNREWAMIQTKARKRWCTARPNAFDE